MPASRRDVRREQPGPSLVTSSESLHGLHAHLLMVVVSGHRASVDRQ